MDLTTISRTDEHFDVVVIGGGPGGIGAAVGAAKTGARTLLIEKHPVLGGMGTAALVNNFCPAHFVQGRPIIGGVFGGLRNRLIERKAIYTYDTIHDIKVWIEPYNPDVFAREAMSLCVEAGVEVRTGRSLAGIDEAVGRIRAILLDDGTGIACGAMVDSTGDGHLAARLGVPFTFGRTRDRAVMPLTYCYLMGVIDLETARRETPEFIFHDPNVGEDFFFLSGWYPAVDEKIAEARRLGELSIERDHISGIFGTPNMPGHATVNFGRVMISDPTDPVAMAAAEKIGRRQVEEGLRFFQKYLPGFEGVELKQLALQIGVRESRQICGLHTLTGEEVLGGTQFPDVIAQCSYPVDIHEPGSDKTTISEIGGPGHYDIPWRCLIPVSGPDNLVVGGRCISATHEAMSSFRVSPSVMAIGEAAGVTAGLASKRGVTVREVSSADVQQQLLATGGILD